MLDLLTPGELSALRRNILASIQAIDAAGACERVEALCRLPPPQATAGPLSRAPALVLYAEKESSVPTENSPTRMVFESEAATLLPGALCRVVRGGANPVQHASLIFHYYEFLQPTSVSSAPRRASCPSRIDRPAPPCLHLGAGLAAARLAVRLNRRSAVEEQERTLRG